MLIVFVYVPNRVFFQRTCPHVHCLQGQGSSALCQGIPCRQSSGEGLGIPVIGPGHRDALSVGFDVLGQGIRYPCQIRFGNGRGQIQLAVRQLRSIRRNHPGPFRDGDHLGLLRLLALTGGKVCTHSAAHRAFPARSTFGALGGAIAHRDRRLRLFPGTAAGVSSAHRAFPVHQTFAALAFAGTLGRLVGCCAAGFADKGAGCPRCGRGIAAGFVMLVLAVQCSCDAAGVCAAHMGAGIRRLFLTLRREHAVGIALLRVGMDALGRGRIALLRMYMGAGAFRDCFAVAAVCVVLDVVFTQHGFGGQRPRRHQRQHQGRRRQ